MALTDKLAGKQGLMGWLRFPNGCKQPPSPARWLPRLSPALCPAGALPAPPSPAQALLEERRRARVDLQPLLQQLGTQLAQALAGAGGGSGNSSSGGVSLAAVRQACLEGGGPLVQASMQVGDRRAHAGLPQLARVLDSGQAWLWRPCTCTPAGWVWLPCLCRLPADLGASHIICPCSFPCLCSAT